MSLMAFVNSDLLAKRLPKSKETPCGWEDAIVVKIFDESHETASTGIYRHFVDFARLSRYFF